MYNCLKFPQQKDHSLNCATGNMHENGKLMALTLKSFRILKNTGAGGAGNHRNIKHAGLTSGERTK